MIKLTKIIDIQFLYIITNSSYLMRYVIIRLGQYNAWIGICNEINSVILHFIPSKLKKIHLSNIRLNLTTSSRRRNLYHTLDSKFNKPACTFPEYIYIKKIVHQLQLKYIIRIFN